jgi:hypothetical protein
MAEQRRELEDSGEPQDQKLERVCPLGRVCIAAEYPGPKPGYMVTGDAFAGGRGSGVDAYPRQYVVKIRSLPSTIPHVPTRKQLNL